MDPREASLVVTGRRDLSSVTYGTWLGELRRMAGRLGPDERAQLVDHVFHRPEGGERDDVDLLALTDHRLLLGHTQDGRAIPLDEISDIEGSDKQLMLALGSGERIEIRFGSKELAQRFWRLSWALHQKDPGPFREAAQGHELQLWQPSPEQRRRAFMASLLRPVLFVAVVVSAGMLTALIGVLAKEVLGFDGWSAAAIPVWVLLSALFALIGARVGVRDHLREAMHGDAARTLGGATAARKVAA